MWLREALSDERNQGDIAYASIGVLVVAMASSVTFLCAMSAISYSRCQEIVDVGKAPELVRASIPCKYDPNPLGLAIAACLAAFGSPISALALYMNQTRRREVPAPQGPPMVAAADNVNIQQAAAPALASVPATKPTKRKGARR